MSTINDFHNKMKSSIDDIDDLTVRNILELLEIKPTSVWWGNEPTEDVWTNAGKADEATEEKQLSYEEVKKQYPHWFQ
jgi:hypothetical protein